MKAIAIVLTVAVGLGALLMSRAALAGQKDRPAVFVQSGTGAGSAYGSLGTARNFSSSDTKSQIGCTLTMSGGTVSAASCSATDSTGLHKQCTFAGSPPARALLAMLAVSDDSLLWFAWDSAGHCTELIVYNYSQYEPKLP